jgi:ubiquinone biosynthesis protein
VTERFAGFGVEALAAASLAQVHGARLADGRAVAVKVQLPGIAEVVAADVAALGILAGALGDLIPGDLGAIAAELGRALTGELDYQAEAAAGAEVAPILAGTPLYVPAVIASHSTARVLTTDRVDGRRLLEVLDAGDRAERTRILAALADGIARQIFRGGVVHADPHPGNFLVDGDGRIAVLDWGCVLRLAPAERAGYARLVLALAIGDRARAAAELTALGFGGDPEALATIAASITAVLRPGVSAATVDWDAQAEALVRDVTVRARAARATVPRSFVLLGRVLGTLAGLFAVYQPSLELAAVIGPHVAAAAGDGAGR